MGPPEAWLARTLFGLFDTFATGAELSAWSEEVVERCAELLKGAEVVLALVDASDVLGVCAASSEAARHVGLVEVQAAEGPGRDALGASVGLCNVRLDAEAARWPRYVAAARDAGYTSVHAFPLRRCEQALGSLVVLDRSAAARAPHELQIAQVLADVATLALLQERTLQDEHALAAQLQTALHSRVAVEQAKGFLAGQLGVGVDDAFSLLRTYARSHARPLDEIARGVVDRSVAPDALIEVARIRARRRCAPPAAITEMTSGPRRWPPPGVA